MQLCSETHTAASYVCGADCLAPMQITDRGMEALASQCHSLKSLNLTWCGALTDRSVEAIATGTVLQAGTLMIAASRSSWCSLPQAEKAVDPYFIPHLLVLSN